MEFSCVLRLEGYLLCSECVECQAHEDLIKPALSSKANFLHINKLPHAFSALREHITSALETGCSTF